MSKTAANDDAKEQILWAFHGRVIPFDYMCESRSYGTVMEMIEDGWIEGERADKMKRTGYDPCIRIRAILAPAGRFLEKRKPVSEEDFEKMSPGELEAELDRHPFPYPRHLAARRWLDKRQTTHREEERHGKRLDRRWVKWTAIATAIGAVAAWVPTFLPSDRPTMMEFASALQEQRKLRHEIELLHAQAIAAKAATDDLERRAKNAESSLSRLQATLATPAPAVPDSQPNPNP